MHTQTEVLKGTFAPEGTDDAGARKLLQKTHITIKKVTSDIEKDYHFNTAIAALMELLNELTAFSYRSKADADAFRFAVETLLTLLSPFAPHIAEELWETLGNEGMVMERQWPRWDEETAREDEIELVLQINGKVRSKLKAAAGLPDSELKQMALADAKIQEFLEGKEPKKVFVIKGRLVNIVS